jgi:hypothetical protein
MHKLLHTVVLYLKLAAERVRSGARSEKCIIKAMDNFEND